MNKKENYSNKYFQEKDSKTVDYSSIKILHLCNIAVDKTYEAITNSLNLNSSGTNVNNNLKIWNENESMIEIINKLTNILLKINTITNKNNTMDSGSTLSKDDIMIAMQFCMKKIKTRKQKTKSCKKEQISKNHK